MACHEDPPLYNVLTQAIQLRQQRLYSAMDFPTQVRQDIYIETGPYYAFHAEVY